MQPCAFLNGFSFGKPALSHRKCRVLSGLPVFGRRSRRKLSDEILLPIENFQLHAPGCRWQEIVDHRAIRRILRRGLLGRKRRARKRIAIHANRRRRAIKIKTSAAIAVRFQRLTQRRDVIQNPKRTPVRCNQQIVAVDRKIANRSDGQVQLQGLPVVPIVPRDVNSKFGSGKEQPFALRVFAHRAQE